MQFWDRFEGVASIKITSADPPGILQRIQNADIRIFNVISADAFTICFDAKRKDIRSITRICKKRGDRIDVEGWTGYIYYLFSLLRRPIFLCGLFSWLFLSLWLPTRILFITVSGADSLEDAYILECAAKCGIHMGAAVKEVRSEQVKNALLSKIPALQWAGVNTYGCVASIRVQEKPQEESSSSKAAVSDILASQDAVISDITVYAGTALCKPGQAVKQGQALISCYQDNGQVLKYTGAGGEVFGETQRHLQATTPVVAYKRTEILSEEVNYYIIIGKNSINFQKDSGILDASCVKMYEVKEWELPGGFPLPVFLVKERITQYVTEPVNLSDTDFSWLADYAETYLNNDMVAGSIRSSQITTKQDENTFSVLGTYDCREMIADYEYKGISDNDGENS